MRTDCIEIVEASLKIGNIGLFGDRCWRWCWYVLRRDEGGITHFMVTTLWSSMDAIRSFAGESPDRARYYPQDDEFLLEREPLVTHYDVLMAITGPPTS